MSLAMILCLFLTQAGCALFYFLSPETQKPVKAEYAKMGSRKIAVVVWADRSTLDIDRRARRRVCDAVLFEMRKHLTEAGFIDARKVEDLQERSGLDWESMTHAELCRRLKADMILRVDLLEFTPRAADTRELRRGRVRATVNLYEGGDDASEEAVYQTEAIANYPPSNEPITELSDSDLMREVTVEFGQAVARKFYDHEVSYRGRPGG